MSSQIQTLSSFLSLFQSCHTQAYNIILFPCCYLQPFSKLARFANVRLVLYWQIKQELCSTQSKALVEIYYFMQLGFS
jgi:hypothetical protein